MSNLEILEPVDITPYTPIHHDPATNDHHVYGNHIYDTDHREYVLTLDIADSDAFVRVELANNHTHSDRSKNGVRPSWTIPHQPTCEGLQQVLNSDDLRTALNTVLAHATLYTDHNGDLHGTTRVEDLHAVETTLDELCSEVGQVWPLSIHDEFSNAADLEHLLQQLDAPLPAADSSEEDMEQAASAIEQEIAVNGGEPGCRVVMPDAHDYLMGLVYEDQRDEQEKLRQLVRQRDELDETILMMARKQHAWPAPARENGRKTNTLQALADLLGRNSRQDVANWLSRNGNSRIGGSPRP